MRDVLRVLQDKVDDRVSQSIAAAGGWPCRKGCDGCCRSLARLPLLTPPEAEWVLAGFNNLSATQRSEILHRLASLQASDRHVTCPFLDDAFGTCSIYQYRPVSCRSYGFYAERDGGLYCSIIASGVERGDYTNVIWGNGEAVQAELDSLGPRIDLLDVFAMYLRR